MASPRGGSVVAVVVVVALPFLREPAPASDSLHALDGGAERGSTRSSGAIVRSRLWKEAPEANHRAGLISDEDYRSVVQDAPARRGDALRAVDGLDAEREGTPTGSAKSA